MEQAYVPMHFLKNLVHLVAEEEGISVARVLQSADISQADLEEDGAFATFAQSTQTYERVAELSSLPGIGFRSPSAQSFSDQGVLGAMMMMAPTVGQALQELSKFIDVVGGAVSYNLRQEGGNFIVTTEDKDSYSFAAHKLVAEENLAVWRFIGLPIPGLESYLKELRLDYPKPNNWRMYLTLFPNCEIKFDQREIGVVLSSDVIDLPIQTSNPEAYIKMQNACEDLLIRIQPTYKNYVIDFFQQSHPSKWNVQNVVDALDTNYKSLARHLKNEGLTPKTLVSEQKKNYAISMMARGVSDAKISTSLGYADKSSFARGFKNWTGLTPAQYRRQNWL